MSERKYGFQHFSILLLATYFLFHCVIYTLEVTFGKPLRPYALLAQGLILNFIFFSLVYATNRNLFSSVVDLKNISSSSALQFAFFGFIVASLVWFASFYFSVNHFSKEYRQLISLPGTIYYRILYLVVLAPFFEEIIWRGYAYPAVKKSAGLVISLIITSAIFAVLHMPKADDKLLGFTLSFCFSAILTLIKEKTKNTTACIVFHSSYNLAPQLLRLIRL